MTVHNIYHGLTKFVILYKTELDSQTYHVKVFIVQELILLK